jgi:ketosteroid isomerase-like protein
MSEEHPMAEVLQADLSVLDISIDDLASKGDFAALAALLADDFVYSHSTGLVQNKQEWLKSLQPLVGKRNRVAAGVTVEAHGDVAVVKGNLDVVWFAAPTKYNRYVRIYRQHDGAWRAISQVTSPAPDREPAAK